MKEIEKIGSFKHFLKRKGMVINMKPEELFEILSDIDENMVDKAKAGQSEELYAEPQVVIARKKFPWKAACAAMAAAAGISAAALWYAGSGFSLPSRELETPTDIYLTPHNSESESENHVDYPAGADYVYDGNISELSVEKTGEVDRKSYELYDLLERDSDLVVYGTFTDDAHQRFDPMSTDILNSTQYLQSFNKFRIDKILKGDGIVKEGDEIVICQDYAVYGGNVLTVSGLTPMIKGDEWFYCLTKAYDSETYYYATGDTDGRYKHVLNRDDAYSPDITGVYEKADYRQNIHRLVCERFSDESFIPDIRYIVFYPDESKPDLFERTETFELAEFPGVYFVWNAYELKAVKGDEETSLYGGMPIWDLYAVDLNGDGKRELCSTVSIGSGVIDNRITVYDFENGELYELSDRMKYDYNIDIKETLKSDKSDTFYYSKKLYNTNETVEIKALSLDVMKKAAGSAENEDGGHSTYEIAEGTDSSFGEQGKAYETAEQSVPAGENASENGDMEKVKEERLRFAEEYKPFGVSYDESADQWYWNGEKVRYFRDILTSNGESLESGNFSGSMRTMSGEGTVDIYTVRNFENTDLNGVGKLVGIKRFEEEVDPDAIMIEA